MNLSGSVALDAAAANIAETATAGTITAGTLQIQSATGALLNDANAVDTFTPPTAPVETYN